MGPVIPKFVDYIEEDMGFHPECSEKPLEIFKHGFSWSDLNISETTVAAVNALKGDKETRETS